MIKSKGDYVKYLEADRLAGYSRLKRPRPFFDYDWRYLRCLRKVEYLTNCKSGKLNQLILLYFKYKLYKLRLKTGFTIPQNTFKEGLTLWHTGTIIVNGTARIGINCTLSCCTNIAKNVIIGDDVFIAPGVKILENVQIADGVVIGANAVVSRSILEPNITAFGVPARKQEKRG